MRKNSFLGMTKITIHSAFISVSCALILWLVHAIICIRTDNSYTGKFSVIIMLISGLLMCKKHMGLCASVNAASHRRFFSMVFLGFVLAAIFAFSDTFIVTECFSDQSSWQLDSLFESLYYSDNFYPVTLFNVFGIKLLIKITIFYHTLFILGYITYYITVSKPSLIVIFLSASILSSLCMLLFDKIETVLVVQSLFLILISPAVIPIAIFSILNETGGIFYIMLLYAIFLLQCMILSLYIKPKIKREKING